jgi:hypothetical protein
VAAQLEEYHADDQFVEFFYGPKGLNMMAFMTKSGTGCGGPSTPSACQSLRRS